MHIVARELFHERRIALPDDARLLREVKSVVSKPTTGGGLAISSPCVAGSHGDLCSALVLAMWASELASKQSALEPFIVDRAGGSVSSGFVCGAQGSGLFDGRSGGGW